MLTFHCAFCRAKFADLGLFCAHVGQRHGIRACQSPVGNASGAERVRAWRERQADDPAYRERERRRAAAYRQGGRG